MTNNFGPDRPLPSESHDKQPTSDELDKQLRELLDSPQLQTSLHKIGPIYENQLPEDLRYSEAFDRFILNYEWPTKRNTEGMLPIRPERYINADDFWQQLYVGRGDKSLNNFKHWLQAKPIDNYGEVKNGTDVYGLNPALHRGYVIAGDLLGTLRQAIVTMKNDYATSSDPHRWSETDYQVIEGLSRPALSEAAYAAYIIIGRLVTKEDEKILSIMIGEDDQLAEEVTDVHRKLWT
jgi:hypothetical protein